MEKPARFYSAFSALVKIKNPQIPILILLVLLLMSACTTRKPVVIPVPPTTSKEGAGYVRIAQQMAVDGQFKSSNFFYKKAIANYEKAGQWEDAVKCYIKIGDNFQWLDDNSSAIGNLNQALTITKKHLGYQPLELAKSFQRLGFKHLKNKEYDRALELYRKALGIQLEVLGEDHGDVAKTYNSISLVLWNKNKPIEAQNNYNKSYSIKLKQFAGLPDNLKKKYRYIEKKNKKFKLGEFRKARDFYNRSIAAYMKQYGESSPLFADIFQQIGMLFAFEGDYNNALSYLRRALKIRLDAYGDKSSQVIDSYLDMGICLRLKGDYMDASAVLHQALLYKEEQSGKYHPSSASFYYQLGKVHFQLRQWNKALTYFQESLMAMVPGFTDRSFHTNPSLDQVFDRYKVLDILSAKAKTLKMTYIRQTDKIENLNTAYNIYLRLANVVDQIRRGYKSESYKLYFGEKIHNLFQEAIQTSLLLYEITSKNKYKESAFILSEKSKAAVLAEALSEARAKQFAGISDNMLKEERELNIQLTWYNTYLRKEYRKKENADVLKIKKLEEKYYTLLKNYREMIDNFEKNYAKYYDLKYKPHNVDITAIQSKLARGEALLEYFIGEGLVHIFVLSRRGLQVESIPIHEDLDVKIDEYYRSIKKIEENRFIALSQELYKLLFGPVYRLLKRKGIRKLIIIPDGRLFYVPFESLSAGTRKGELRHMDYMIKHFAFSYHYSANLWLFSANNGHTLKNHSFVGFAPVFGPHNKKGYILDHSPSVSRSAAVTGPMRTGSGFRQPAREKLPASEEELRAIIDLFKNQRKRAAGYFYKEATESSFKKVDMKDYNLIHIATHSLDDGGDHKLSGLIFANNDPVSQQKEDGILYSGEIYNLDLDAELIVLSSCESGVGKLVKGEGMMALNRGFFYSGIHNIVFSLWKVEDRSTSRLMIAFYRNILKGLSFSRALQKAKLELLKNPFTAFPKYWSAFILVGK